MQQCRIAAQNEVRIQMNLLKTAKNLNFYCNGLTFGIY